MKKIVISVGALLLFIGLGYGAIRGLTSKIYHSCTCYRFNIDNVETRAGFNIPRVDSVNCDYDEIAKVKTNEFFFQLDQDMENYAKKNGFEKITESTYVNNGKEEDHSWQAEFNSNTGKLDVVLTYVNL